MQNRTWVFLFLMYLSVALSLTFGLTYVSFVPILVVFVILSTFFWRLYLYPRGNLQKHSAFLSVEKHAKWLPVSCFCIVFGCSIIYWLAYYPGGFNLDAYGQWMQAHGTLQYNDWHPIMSTLLLKLVISVWDSFRFYIFLQIILFSLSIAVLIKAMQNHGVRDALLLIIAVYIGASPSIGLNTICLTKDAQFTILVVNLTTCYIEIITTKGRWLNHALNIIILGVLSGLAMLVRHNGVLFVAPSFLILLLCYRPQMIKTDVAILIALIAVLIVKVPVTNALQVEPHDNVVGEAVGIPMAVMANALVEDPENIPEEVHAYLNTIASDEDWQTYYYPGEWDSCKWEFGGVDLLKGESLSRILVYAWDTVIHCPQAAYESVRENTRIIWDIFKTPPYWIPEEYIAPNDVGIASATVLPLHSVFEGVKTVSLIPILSSIIWNSGFQIAIILITYCLNHKCVRPQLLLLFIPLLAYDFGTTLLLAGPNQRYFFCNAVLYLPIVLMLLNEGAPE